METGEKGTHHNMGKLNIYDDYCCLVSRLVMAILKVMMMMMMMMVMLVMEKGNCAVNTCGRRMCRKPPQLVATHLPTHTQSPQRLQKLAQLVKNSTSILNI